VFDTATTRIDYGNLDNLRSWLPRNLLAKIIEVFAMIFFWNRLNSWNIFNLKKQLANKIRNNIFGLWKIKKNLK
jgi:hypothetical protein